MAVHSWTESEVEWAVAVLGQHTVLASACKAMSAALGRGIDSSCLTRVFRRRNMQDPVTFLSGGQLKIPLPRPASPVARSGVLRADTPPVPEQPGETPETPLAPPRGPIESLPITPPVPVGHEVGGVSTLADSDGNIDRQWTKTRVAGNPNPAPPPPDFAITRLSTMRRGDGSEAVRWESYDRAKADQHAALMAAWDRHAERYAGLVKPAPAPKSSDDSILTVYPIGDHHLGLLSWKKETGESWDLERGCDYLLATTGELVAMAPPAEQAIVVNLGDFLHAQDGRQLTPGHGNKLDVDGRHAKVADAALILLVGVIDAALLKHKRVMFRNLPGNHDPEVATGIARELRAWYRNEPRVTIADAYRFHQYDRFGKNLLGYAHGHGGPSSELAGIMAVDEAEAWGQTEFHYWHCGHVHHKIRDKEHPGVIVETHRIIPPGDAWHAMRYRAGRGMSAITYDFEYGEVMRATVGIKRVRAVLEKAS